MYISLHSQKIKNINYGIEILRVLLSFTVILNHFYIKKKKYIFLLLNHIPTFFLMSFYFGFTTLSTLNTLKIKNRLERLLIPYFFWSIFFGLINNITLFKQNKILLYNNLFIIIRRLLFGLINGHSLIYAYWFQINLIFITFLYIFIIFFFNEHYLLILKLLVLISYIFQYSKLNIKLFENVNIHVTKTYGRILEVFPNTVIGFNLFKLNLIQKFKKSKLYYFFFSFSFLYIINKYNIFKQTEGFYYSGIRLNINALLYFIIFSLLPFESIKSKRVFKILNYLTSYTGGIYFLHIPIQSLLKNYIVLIKKSTFIGCCIIYLFCYLICFFGIKLLKETKFRYLFS